MDVSGGVRGGKRVGVREVAALAGVSTQTVSRVINDHESVRPETRRLVLEAMGRLGYRVNNAARSLGTSRSRTLGVIASDSTLYGPSVGIAALETAARAEGRWTATAYADAADAASVTDALEHLLAQGVDGILLVALHAAAVDVVRKRATDVPVAALHAGRGAERQAEGAALAVGHLAALGHRRVVRLGGPADWTDESARAAGFDRAVEDAGMDVRARWSGDWSAAAGAAAASEAAASLREPSGPTAIVVANDQMALGLVAGLRVEDVAVPRDVSVVGFDDNPDAAFYRPALTTVRLDIAGEARRCVDDVLGLETSASPRPAELIVRASTAPPAR